MQLTANELEILKTTSGHSKASQQIRKRLLAAGFQFCSICSKVLPWSEFHKNKSGPRRGKPINRCIECAWLGSSKTREGWPVDTAANSTHEPLPEDFDPDDLLVDDFSDDSLMV